MRALPALMLICVVVMVLSSCQTNTGGRDPSETPGILDDDAGPELPQSPEPATGQRTTPLRYPRLLDDPESAPDGASGEQPAGDGQWGTTRTGGTRRPVTDPLIEDLLASLSLRQRIGQRFIVHVPGSRVTYGAGRSIVEVAPAGFILYPWNFDTADDVVGLTTSLQRLAGSVTPGISLLLCADQEGGRVATFRFPEFVRVPAARTMGGLDAGSIEAAAYLIGVQMQKLGLNMNLAPVLDVDDGAANSIIGDRSYSGDPATVAEVVAPYLQGSRRAGIISVAKHFPGHGLTAVDSHAALPVVETTMDEIRSRDLVPFVTAIDAGIEVIMTAHILFESIDPFYPVTLSRFFLKDFLRGELGFDGVIMSDGLEMGAIRDNYGLTESLIRLFRNDVDLILLFVNYDVVELVDQVEELIRIGELTEDDINRGTRRVLRLKLENGLADPEGL
jgi:beta-N-acetylhexosaminidase